MKNKITLKLRGRNPLLIGWSRGIRTLILIPSGCGSLKQALLEAPTNITTWREKPYRQEIGELPGLSQKLRTDMYARFTSSQKLSVQRNEKRHIPQQNFQHLCFTNCREPLCEDLHSYIIRITSMLFHT
jgi:hypothetical protein